MLHLLPDEVCGGAVLAAIAAGDHFPGAGDDGVASLLKSRVDTIIAQQVLINCVVAPRLLLQDGVLRQDPRHPINIAAGDVAPAADTGDNGRLIVCQTAQLAPAGGHGGANSFRQRFHSRAAARSARSM